MTLGGDETSGWVSRTTVDLLRVASGIAGQQFALLLRGTTYTVLFDHEAGALEAAPVLDVSDPVAADLYVITLRFIKA